jgi:hypothetical protein
MRKIAKKVHRPQFLKRILQKTLVPIKTLKTLATITVGVLIVGVFGVLYYRHWQAIEGLQLKINVLPTLPTPILQDKKIELEKELITLENSAINTLAQVVGGLLLFVTAYISYKNLKATEEKQITERFTQAINQLGNEKMTVRCGGIYALERIAKDSPKDHWTIIEVLTSFIKEQSPILVQKPVSPITTDVQAAITVIRRRNTENEELPSQHIDLSKTNLRGANLRKANLIRPVGK